MQNGRPETCDDDLLDLLYSATGDAGIWTEFLGLLARRTDATAIALLSHDPANLQYASHAQVGFSARRQPALWTDP